MKQNKLSFSAIAILLIAFFTTSWVSPTASHHPTPITISVPFDITGGAFPFLTFGGHFTTNGAIESSGHATMDATFNVNARRIHCVWTFTDGEGTFTLHEQCVYAASGWQGRWEIISGTGAYANIHGNGSSLMPERGDGKFWEELTGLIY